MAHPKRRHSNTRSRLRRAHDFLTAGSIGVCANCKRPVKTHCICPFCGYYKGRQVITIKAKKRGSAQS